MNQVKLLSITDEIAKQLWESGQSDRDWPEGCSSQADFAAFVEEWRAAEVMGFGEMLAVSGETSGSSANLEIYGFVTFHVLDPMWSTQHHVIVECGTYLLPKMRGQGWNRPVKGASVSHAFKRFGADVVVYAVPEDNLRAISSLSRIVGDDGALSEGQDTTSELKQILKRWLSYRTWKEGKPFRLFVIPLKSTKTSHLLNPDGNNGHLVREQEQPHED